VKLRFWIFLVTIINFSCSIKKPVQEAPVPSDNGIEKSFFRNGNNSYKTFIGTYAPVIAIGSVGERSERHFMSQTYHFNLQFIIKKGAIHGRMVNPTFPDDHSQWKTVMTIPISKHYYLEDDTDKYERSLNRKVERTDRSEELARPFMKLNFDKITIQDWAMKMFYESSADVLAVEDIEWDKKNNFFAFTLTASSRVVGAEKQAKFRFNFKAIDTESSEGFTETPYHEDNAQHLNVLHVIGNREDGVYAKYKAAHWNLNKDIPINLFGFPKRFEKIALESIEEWNEVIKNDLKLPGRLVPIVESERPKYVFDLRMPSLTWINDKRISMNAPLGVGQAQANVLNGEILWGGVCDVFSFFKFIGSVSKQILKVL